MDTAVSRLRQAMESIVQKHPHLALLVLFGSRARGDAGRWSDWDLGYRGPVDADGLLLDLVTVLGDDRVDLVDLDRAGGLVRYRAARDGVALHERTPGAFDDLWLDAVGFWCDAAPVLQAGYADLLARLPG